jgi:hypothetical protein
MRLTMHTLLLHEMKWPEPLEVTRALVEGC